MGTKRKRSDAFLFPNYFQEKSQCVSVGVDDIPADIWTSLLLPLATDDPLWWRDVRLVRPLWKKISQRYVSILEHVSQHRRLTGRDLLGALATFVDATFAFHADTNHMTTTGQQMSRLSLIDPMLVQNNITDAAVTSYLIQWKLGIRNTFALPSDAVIMSAEDSTGIKMFVRRFPGSTDALVTNLISCLPPISTGRLNPHVLLPESWVGHVMNAPVKKKKNKTKQLQQDHPPLPVTVALLEAGGAIPYIKDETLMMNCLNYIVRCAIDHTVTYRFGSHLLHMHKRLKLWAWLLSAYPKKSKVHQLLMQALLQKIDDDWSLIDEGSGKFGIPLIREALSPYNVTMASRHLANHEKAAARTVSRILVILKACASIGELDSLSVAALRIACTAAAYRLSDAAILAIPYIESLECPVLEGCPELLSQWVNSGYLTIALRAMSHYDTFFAIARYIAQFSTLPIDLLATFGYLYGDETTIACWPWNDNALAAPAGSVLHSPAMLGWLLSRDFHKHVDSIDSQRRSDRIGQRTHPTRLPMSHQRITTMLSSIAEDLATNIAISPPTWVKSVIMAATRDTDCATMFRWYLRAVGSHLPLRVRDELFLCIAPIAPFYDTEALEWLAPSLATFVQVWPFTNPRTQVAYEVSKYLKARLEEDPFTLQLYQPTTLLIQRMDLDVVSEQVFPAIRKLASLYPSAAELFMAHCKAAAQKALICAESFRMDTSSLVTFASQCKL